MKINSSDPIRPRKLDAKLIGHRHHPAMLMAEEGEAMLGWRASVSALIDAIESLPRCLAPLMPVARAANWGV
jgi:hypothetical protein